MKKLSQVAFLERCREKHGDIYDYSKVVYSKMKDSITIVCREHGPFKQAAGDHVYGRGCAKCGDLSVSSVKTKNLSAVLSEFKKKHGDTYDYSKVKYVNGLTPVIIICASHGPFKQRPSDHRYGQGCPDCGKLKTGDSLRRTTSDFTESAKLIHGQSYTYRRSVYKGSHEKVVITCPKHGDFLQTPTNHLSGNGCPSCRVISLRAYSKIAIRWIKSESRLRKLKGVRHAENGGEYTIPGTSLRVDGYHKPSKTVFEFHGDCWHGNPDVYKPNDKPNPFRPEATARTLYKETLAREQRLRDLGFTVVVMWQNDYCNS